jgi:hypothetical protein
MLVDARKEQQELLARGATSRRSATARSSRCAARPSSSPWPQPASWSATASTAAEDRKLVTEYLRPCPSDGARRGSRLMRETTVARSYAERCSSSASGTTPTTSSRRA